MKRGQPVFDRQNVKAHSLFVGNYVEKYQQQCLEHMTAWVSAGKVKYKEDLWQGLEQAPAAFSAMLAGGNFGKTLVAVGEDPTINGVIRENRADGNVLAQTSGSSTLAMTFIRAACSWPPHFSHFSIRRRPHQYRRHASVAVPIRRRPGLAIATWFG